MRSFETARGDSTFAGQLGFQILSTLIPQRRPGNIRSVSRLVATGFVSGETAPGMSTRVEPNSGDLAGICWMFDCDLSCQSLLCRSHQLFGDLLE